MHLLSGDYLFNTPSGTPSGWFLALTIAFAVLLVAAIVAYFRRAKLIPNDSILRRLLRRASSTAIWLAAIGLFLALMRYVNFPYLEAPILMLLLIFAIIFAVGYYVYDLSERYPLAVHRLEASHASRRFRPPVRQRAEPQRPRPKVRGKRRR